MSPCLGGKLIMNQTPTTTTTNRFTRKLLLSLAAGAAGLVALPATALAAQPKQARAPLVRPAVDPPDSDAKGRIDLRSHRPGEDRFEVRVELIDSSSALEAFLEDAVGAGTFTSIGMLEARNGSKATLKFDQRDGPLPFGVGSVEELAGLELQVQIIAAAAQAGGQGGISVVNPILVGGGPPEPTQLLVHGRVPEFPEEDIRGWLRGRGALTRPESPPDPDARGTIEAATKPSENRDRLIIEAHGLPAGSLSFSLFMAIGDGQGGMTEVADLSQSAGDPEKVRLKIDTKKGDPLPFDVFDIEELQGRVIHVRGDDGLTYLQGVVPEFTDGTDGDLQRVKADLIGPGGGGKVKLVKHLSFPLEKLKVIARTGLTNATVELFVEDPDDNVLKLVAPVPTDSDGKGEFKVDTSDGTPLPFFAQSLDDLAGMHVEVRDPATMLVLVSGIIPAF